MTVIDFDRGRMKRIARRAARQAASSRREASAARALADRILAEAPTWTHRADVLRELAALDDDVAAVFDAVAGLAIDHASILLDRNSGGAS